MPGAYGASGYFIAASIGGDCRSSRTVDSALSQLALRAPVLTDFGAEVGTDRPPGGSADAPRLLAHGRGF